MNEIAVGRPRSIPMALGHDLLFGYTTELLTQHKVRWIEMAAVLPMWTHMIVYYVEGNAGHVMNQVVGKAEWRSNVKGQCFSFIMPWAQLIREFKTRMERDDLLSLPRGEHTLQYLFRIHLKVAGEAFTDDLRQVRLRPYVLLLLLSWLWRTRPDLFDRKTRSQKAFMAEMQRRIQELYPETEGHLPEEEREGQIPPAFQKMLRKAEDSGTDDETQHPPRKTTKFVTDTKNATPASAPDTCVDAAIENSEPRCCILDGNQNLQISEAAARSSSVRKFEGGEASSDSEMAAAPGGQSEGARVRSGILQLETGCEMQEQWTGDYISKALPFTIPKPIKGPTFFPSAAELASGLQDGRPLLTITTFLRGFVRRVENLCHSDWSAVPILRSLWFKYTAYTSKRVQAKFNRGNNQNLTTVVSDHVVAMQKLAKALDSGVVGRGVLKIPVAGDVTRLPFAEGLTDFERRLAREIVFKASMMPGTLPCRRLMGNCATGARVAYGEALFLTWSPNEQQSALVLRLMRNRRKDPMLRGASIEDEALRQCSGRDVPAITADGLENSVTIQLPLYHVRRKLTARDPRAVVAAYRYEVKFKLPMLLGLRVCPDCPNCNIYVDGYVLRSPCQDIFGLNTLPMGGLAGLAGTMGGATEFQKCNTPHEHAHVHLVNIYQHRTLAEIAEAIEKAWLDPQTILRFNEWIHVEDTILPSQYAADRDTVALAWHKRYDDGKHEGICSIPSSVTRALDIPVEESTSESWCQRYDRDAQYMFSRVQEHVHQKTKNGYIPLRACLSARCKTKCKHGFPKKIMVRCTVVCNGNYRHLKVRISGRRSAFGASF